MDEAATREAEAQARYAERNRLIEQQTPAHEKAVVVRVPAAEPTFRAQLPHERWRAWLWLIPALYSLYYLLFFGALIAGAGALAKVIVALLSVGAIALLGGTIARIARRPEVSLDRSGLRYVSPGWFPLRKERALAQVRRFAINVERRKIDNTERFRIEAIGPDESRTLLGMATRREDAERIVSGLEETLATLRYQASGYR